MGGDPKKLFATGKACGRQSTKVFIREILYFNQFRKFSPAKVPKYSSDKVIVSVTAPTHHAHEPLGIQILARTLMYKGGGWLVKNHVMNTKEKPAATPFLNVLNKCKPDLHLILNPKAWL